MEKLFVQIFESKKRIIEQVQHQIDQFDQYLSSICLLDGIDPPSWLVSSSFPPASSDLNGMKRDELISGLLLQRSQSANPHFNSHYSLYQEPYVTAGNEMLPNASFTEAYASNNVADAGDRLSLLPPFPIDDTQCTFSNVPELDDSVTSPPDFSDARISGSCQDLAQSLVKIQRSKSRQRALELRSSAKASKLKSCEDNTAGGHTSQNTQSRVNTLQYDHFDELVLAKHVDANNENFGEESKSIECAGKEKNCDIDCDRTIGTGSCSQQISFVNETQNDGNLSFIGKKDGLNMHSNSPLSPSGCVIGLSESFDPSILANSWSGAEANLVDCRGNKKINIVCYDKMAESRTSITEDSTHKEPFEAGNSCVAEVDDGDKRSLEKSAKYTSSNNELLKSSPVISNKSHKARKANRRDKGFKEKASNIYVARITRSRSSHQNINCMNECLELEKSHGNGKENGVSKTKQLPDDAHDLMELVKPLDTTFVSGGVRAELKDGEKVDAENSACGCRITTSLSTKKINDFIEFPKVEISSGIAKHGDGVLLQSLGISAKPPQRSSFVEEGVHLQIPSGIRPDILPTPESIMAENVTDIHINGIAETCSVTPKSNSGTVGCGVEHSESRPPSKSAIDVKAKQLDFDGVEESSLFNSFNLAVESKQEGITDLLDDSIEMPLRKQQEDSSKQEKVRMDSSEANLKNIADLVEETCFNSAQKVVGSDESRPPSECAIVIKAKQLDFGDVEESSLLKSFNLALENKQEGITEKRLSPLLDDSLEKPSICTEMSLQIQQEDSNKQEKVRKDSSEANVKYNADLVEERSFGSAQQVVDPIISRSQRADFFSMGSWPQHKRMKIGSQHTNSLSPSLKRNPCQPFDKCNIGDAVQSDAMKSPVDDAARNVNHQNIEESKISLSKLHGHEVAINMERKSGTNALTPMLEQAATAVASLSKLEDGFSPGRLLHKPEVANPNSTVFDVARQHTAEDNHDLLQDSYNGNAIQERISHFGGKNSLPHLSSGFPCGLSLVGTDQNMPEYERFSVESDAKLPCTANEVINFDKLDLPLTALRRGSVQDQFCKSISMCTPLSHTTAYESHEALNLYHSIPTGLLEGMELMDILSVDVDESKLINSSYSCLNEGVNNDLHERSQSVSAWDISKPCMSPVGKFWDGMPPKSSSSGKRVSSIPELPCISEENENTDGVADTLLESSSQVDMSLVKRDPLADITKNLNPLTSVCETEIQDGRSSIASVNTEFGLSGTIGRKKLRDHNKRRSTSRDKENQNISLGGGGVKRGKESVRCRFSKPKLSEKAGLRKGGPSLSEKESKRSNIVSNITSFLPLVQQKQAAAVITGKRDIKVKSLEAAEAAKRLAEKKENERKMRKEALKIERAKMEETNLRQLELERKKKEEEKKKKEADMAAKKRQREEEERKERERKRMRTEEAKRTHLEYEKKLQSEKEEREVKSQAPDERACNRKEPKKIEKAKVDNNLRNVPGAKPPTIKVSTIGNIDANISVEGHEAFAGDNSKVMGFFAKPSENNSLVSCVSQEPSYDISPYKGSDDEDEDGDENMQNNKYRPSWASKSQLALVVSSQQRIDPESIWKPDSFCSISEEDFSRNSEHDDEIGQVHIFSEQLKNSLKIMKNHFA